jgi:hypothetical protein
VQQPVLIFSYKTIVNLISTTVPFQARGQHTACTATFPTLHIGGLPTMSHASRDLFCKIPFLSRSRPQARQFCICSSECAMPLDRSNNVTSKLVSKVNSLFSKAPLKSNPYTTTTGSYICKIPLQAYKVYGRSGIHCTTPPSLSRINVSDFYS